MHQGKLSYVEKIKDLYQEGLENDHEGEFIRIAIFINVLHYQNWILSVLDGKTEPFWDAEKNKKENEDTRNNEDTLDPVPLFGTRLDTELCRLSYKQTNKQTNKISLNHMHQTKYA